MNLVRLVWSYLKARPLNTLLNIVLLSLGIAVIIVLILFSRQLEDKINSNAKGIDLVVGAKGSPLQLILCSVFHIDVPTGNVKLAEAEKLAKHRLVRKAIPMALGDSYNGFRIVGTTRDYPALYTAELAEGDWFGAPLEVTIGAGVAERSGLSIGKKFASAHGLTSDGHDHEDHQYIVKGILKQTGSVIDNLIFSDVVSIWKVHELADSLPVPASPSALVPAVEANDSTREITSLLIQYRNPMAVIQLPRMINSNSRMQAAAPAFESARLFSILGVGIDVLRAFAFVLIVISGLSIFLALYNSLKERRYDMAIMRSMGASRRKLFSSMVLEGVVLTVLGCAVGILMGHSVLAAFVMWVEEGRQAGMTWMVWYSEEAWIAGGGFVLGVICSLIPAWQAYRTDIHRVLSVG